MSTTVLVKEYEKDCSTIMKLQLVALLVPLRAINWRLLIMAAVGLLIIKNIYSWRRTWCTSHGKLRKTMLNWPSSFIFKQHLLHDFATINARHVVYSLRTLCSWFTIQLSSILFALLFINSSSLSIAKKCTRLITDRLGDLRNERASLGRVLNGNGVDHR